jgi:hypothetical protein
LATISGEESVSAMKPSVTLLVSGPAACAKAPAGNEARTALINAAVAATLPAFFRMSRRPSPLLARLVAMIALLLFEDR